MDGDYEVYGSFRSDGTKEHLSDGLYSFLEILSRAGANPPQAKTSLGVVGGWLHGMFERLEYAAHARNSNTQAGSAANIAYHYDAGNDFYGLFLDPATMFYSSGIHPGGSTADKLATLDAATLGAAAPPPADGKAALVVDASAAAFALREQALSDAMYAKVDRLIAQVTAATTTATATATAPPRHRTNTATSTTTSTHHRHSPPPSSPLQLNPKAGERVLEIGCGWGATAVRIAETTGASVVGITLSREQLREGLRRAEAAGVAHLVNLEYCDRNVVGHGTFDKVISRHAPAGPQVRRPSSTLSLHAAPPSPRSPLQVISIEMLEASAT